ncbi:MAG: hypothetical protein HUU17_06290 [Chthonomonadales bacterium]|nr:hypothetical protein [Chthonomonadales bacterium]
MPHLPSPDYESLAAMPVGEDERKANRIRRAQLRAMLRGESYSADEKRAIRRAHSDANAEALRRLETVDGMARFLETRELNPQLTPLAAARVAMDAPGRVVATFREWKQAGCRVRKDEHAISYGTKAPAYWPLPLFAAEQTDYPEELEERQIAETGSPSDELVDAALASLRERFAAMGRKTKALNAWAAESGLGGRLVTKH